MSDRINLYVNGTYLGNFSKVSGGVSRYIRVCLSGAARVVRDDGTNLFIVDEETSFE